MSFENVGTLEKAEYLHFQLLDVKELNNEDNVELDLHHDVLKVRQAWL